MKQIVIIASILALYYGGRYFYFLPKYTQGDSIEDQSFILKDGTPSSIKKYEGTYLLVDFWGSWCGPCRQESPLIVDLYNEFHGKKYKDALDFDVLSIGIESDEKKWEKAIEIDGLKWPNHVYQGQRFDSPLAKYYKVREIPSKFLLDSKGKIMLVNP
ncbi:MAG: hypothetical protein RLZZ546_1788, partial [Bacteroidota bacterium]